MHKIDHVTGTISLPKRPFPPPKRPYLPPTHDVERDHEKTAREREHKEGAQERPRVGHHWRHTAVSGSLM